jgi:mannose-6-phosphate isomerase
MQPEPFRIEPTFSPRIWGSRSLAPIYPDKTNLAEPIGEAWLTDVNCRIAAGFFAGKTLGEAWGEMSPDWRGTRLADTASFPLLVKFLFPTDKLSIQVHPDDAFAGAHEPAAGGRGKTEMWHVVSAEPGAKVLVGLKPGTTRQKFLTALEARTLEDLFLAYTVSAGDTIFVPARTPHTIGPGVILCEVQQYSDLTYRVYDYGRVDAKGKPRELHTEKALEVMHFGPSRSGIVPPVPVRRTGLRRTLLAACRYFATELWEPQRECEFAPDPAHFDLLAILSGSGRIMFRAKACAYRRGECWFLPAGSERVTFDPEEPTSMIRTFVPDLASLHNRLLREGHFESELSKTLFD